MAIENPFKRPKRSMFPTEGVDVNSPLDSPKSRNKASRLKNLTIDSDGSLVIRPGLVNRYAGVLLANKTPVHSIKRISDSSSNASAMIYGVQDRLVNEIANAITNIDGAYSGNPLTIIPWRPTSSPKSFAYIYDSLRQKKLAVDSTTAKPIGLPAPYLPPNVELKDKWWGLVEAFSNAGAWNNLDGVVITGAPSAAVQRQTAVVVTRSIVDNGGVSGWQCVQPASLSDIGAGERLDALYGGPTFEDLLVSEIYRPSSATKIDSIIYDTSGSCVIQPQIPVKEIQRNCLVALNAGGGNQEWVRVLEVIPGYDGKDSFRCVTANVHVGGNTETLQVVGSFRVYSSANISSGGGVFSAYGLQVANAVAGQGWFQRTGLALDLTRIPNQGHSLNNPFTDEDYFHVSLKSADWSLVSMIRVMFDINGDTGATCCTKNYFYYAIEQSKLVAASKGTQTPTDVQRSRINDAGIRDPNATDRFRDQNVGDIIGERIGRRDQSQQRRDQETDKLQDPTTTPVITTPSVPSSPGGTGDNQWAEIRWKRGQMFRVGSDLSKGWQNVTGIRIEITWTKPSPNTVFVDSLTCFGSGAPDIGDIGDPYHYRYRYRESSTGAVSDYSPASRYGVLAYRNDTAVTIWGATDGDKVDIERFGGLQSGWCYVGTVDNPGAGLPTTFTDKMGDLAAIRNAVLSDRRVVQPWARQQTPIASSGANANVAGSTLKVANADALSTALLPGTEIIVDGIATSLRRHYGSAATDTLWELEDSIGTRTNVKWEIPTPVYGGQPLGRVFGPFAGCLFACDGIYVRWTEGNDPDATHEANYAEVTDPTDVTVCGFVFNGRAGVLTTKKLYSISGDPVNGFSFTEVPFGKGAFTPWGIAIGPRVAWIARDGIYESEGDIPHSLTTEDLAPLFPLEGRVGTDTNGLSAPKLDLTEQQYLRLTYLDDGSLMFSYRDNSGNRKHLRYVHDKKRWLPYEYAVPIGMFYALEGDGVTGVVAGGADTPSAKVYTVGGSTDPTVDDGNGFNCQLRPFSDDFDDPRSDKLLGDLIADTNPGSLVGGITAQLLTNNQSVTTALGTITGATRGQTRFDLGAGNGIRAKNATIDLSWTTEAAKKQRLYLWELALLPRPETINLRAVDYGTGGYDGDKYMQGVFIEADTFGVDKTLRVEFDGGQLGATITINHNGRRREPYSFPVPFTARLIRLATADTDQWELYDYEWRFNPEPPAAKTWWIQPTSFDIPGYKHVFQIRPALAAPADVTMTVFVDGNIPSSVLTIPNTGGATYSNMRRLTVIHPALKFKLWTAKLESTSEFRLYLRDTEVLVKGWAENGDYHLLRPFGANARSDVGAPI